MTVKSIVQIDVQDDSFKAFQALFEKYQNQLKKLPGAWAATDKAVGSTAGSFAEMTAALLAQAELLKRADRSQKSMDQSAKSTARSWHDLARSSGAVAGNIKYATAELLKWSGIVGSLSGLIGAGGLFGIDRMAAGVASGRRSAMGTGISYGEQNAFRLNYRRFVDPDAMLGAVSAAQHNNTSEGFVGLLSAGLSQEFLQKHDAAETSVALLHRLPALFKGVPDGMVGSRLDALKLGSVISREDVTRYLAASPKERAEQDAHYASDIGAFGVGSETQKKWTDFADQMTRAGEKIGTVFVNGLVKLEKPLERLSDSFADLATAMLNSPTMKVWITDLSSGLETFSKYVGTPSFKADVESFTENFGRIAKAVGDGLMWLVSGSKPGETRAPIVDLPGFKVKRDNRSLLQRLLDGGSPSGQPGSSPAPNGASADAFLDMVRKLENSGDNAESSKGARGRYQIMPATARLYGFDPDRLNDPAYSAGAARAILGDLSQRYHGNTAEILAAYNAGPKRGDAFRDSGDNVNTLPKETRAYLARARNMPGYTPQVTITINNATGGSAVVSTSQVAQ